MRVEAQLHRLRLHWASYWPGIVDGAAIAADIRARLDDAVTRWGLSELRALGGGQVAVVCAARAADGSSVVLKFNPRGHPEEAQIAGESDGLRFWQPTGAVPRVMAVRDDGFTLLMEQLDPGVPLDESDVAWDDRLKTLGRLVARLHAAGPPPPSFVPMAEFASAWRTALHSEPDLLAQLDELTVPSTGDVLLHADLHGGNALRHANDWKVIDPKAIRGDRHADVWALLDPLVPALPADPADAARVARERLATYATAAGMDFARAAAWTRVRARAEAPMVHDPAWAARLHRLADALR